MCRDDVDDNGPDIDDFEWNSVVGEPIEVVEASILLADRDARTQFSAHIHRVLVRTQHTIWREPEVVVDGYPTSIPPGVRCAHSVHLRLTKAAAIELSLALREAARIAYGADH